MFKKIIITLLSVWLIITSGNCFAWGVTGHKTVAFLAEWQLTPKAREFVSGILAQEPGSDLISIASWADENRDDSNTRWHYVNFTRGNCHFDATRDCPDGQCVVAAINRQISILKSTAPDRDKLVALKFLVHLVGDIHQPLHAGFADDRGGTLYQIQYHGKGSNLHALWDSPIVNHMNRNSKTLAKQIQRQFGNERIEFGAGPVEWAQQSCEIVSRSDFYPSRKVGDQYLDEYQAIAQLQLMRAGTRLAEILNSL